MNDITLVNRNGRIVSVDEEGNEVPIKFGSIHVDGLAVSSDHPEVTAKGEDYIYVAFDSEEHVQSQADRNEIVTSPNGNRKMLRVGFPEEGDLYGSSWRYYTSDWTDRDVAENAHVRYHVYVPPALEFQERHVTGGFKLPGFVDREHGAGWGGRDPTDDDIDGWSARALTYKPGHTWGDGDTVPGIGTQLYHYDSGGGGSEAVGGGPLGDRVGEWVQVDQYVEMNEAGEADGYLGVWVDKELLYDKSDAMYRDSDASFLGVRSLWWNVYFGGHWGAQRDGEWIGLRDLEIWWDRGPQLMR